MSGWLENLITYKTFQVILPCPKCGSAEVKVEEFDKGRKSVSFMCKKCGSGDHFDGVSECVDVNKED